MYNTPSIRTLNKLKCIELLGGKCITCGEKHPGKLVFHHKNDGEDKENILNDLLQGSFVNIFYELNKCILLCSNCHRELHWNNLAENNKTTSKRQYLKFKNVFSCEMCGYSKCEAALDFHHTRDKTKRMALFNLECNGKTVEEFNKSVIDELNKCMVICSNCHLCKHSQFKNYENFDKELIRKKLDNIKIDVSFSPNNVIQDFINGEKNFKVIAKKYKICSLTVKKILLKNGLINVKEIKVDENDIINLHKEGLQNKDIAKKLNCNPITIARTLSKYDKKSNRYTVGKDAIKEYYLNNKEKTYKEIGELLNCSRCYVQEIIGPLKKELNIKPKEFHKKINVNEVISLHRKGIKVKEISKLMGYGERYIHQVIKKYNTID